MKNARMIVVSAPSGAGKSTLCDRLMSNCGNMVYSISCTTRPPRGCEQDGVEYFFLTKEAFQARIKAGDFLEYAEVHGNYYGTLKETVQTSLELGKHVLLDIDVQGAAQIRKQLATVDPDSPLKKGFIDIFIAPPSMEELERRLRSRGTDSEEVIQRRLANATAEMEQAGLYVHQVVNDDLKRACAELQALIA